MARLQLSHVGLEFPIYERLRLWGGAIGGRQNKQVVSALDDVNLDAKEGRRIALLGRNGAGKTSLLKVMAGIYRPTRGCITREGRLGALLNAGIGMNPDATGYENVMIAGLLRGFDRRTIKTKLIPDVEEFTELGHFLALPLRMYSAGMATRLAFAVTTAVETEILLVDEVISAGDLFFMKKARERMDKVLRWSSIVVLASHDLDLVQQLCNEAIVLDKGKVIFAGDVQNGIKNYRVLG